MARRNRKIKQALMYIIVGVIVIFISMMFMCYMYFSGTFLAYKYVLRKILYFLLFVIIIIAFWFVDQGSRYISKVISQKRH